MTTREDFEKLKKLPLFKGKVVSDSMSPVIKVGDEVVVEVGTRDLKRFDIIIIWVEGKLICHYLWQKNQIISPILLQTRNMRGERDYPVPEADYLGKVISHELSLWQKLKFLF